MAIFRLIFRDPITSGTRYQVAWLLAVSTAGIYLYFSWHHYDDPRRRDGNRGHTYIDFGGQYLLGRMLVRGQGGHLFDRSVQRQVLQEAFPPEKQRPEQETSDAEMLMLWFVGNEDSSQSDGNGLGGPLYPPIQAFWFYPLAYFPPQVAYRIMQVLIVLGAFAAGLGIKFMSSGRIWWPMASLAIILFPGLAGCLGLGQNSVFSLAILIWGWVLISQGRPGWGGIVWGLLAFKPVWLAAFFLFPLWTGRWRVCLAMAASGLAQFAFTLPVVSWHGWTDWLNVGAMAMRISMSDEIWIVRGRDLIGLPRRWLDFNVPAGELQNNLTTTLVGWGLWVMVLEITTRIASCRRCSNHYDCGPAFFFFGAWLSCLHFMYYDVLLAALPVCLLYQGPRWPHWICHVLLLGLFLAPALPALGWGEPPLETFCILGLWTASGWDLMRTERCDNWESLLSVSGRETKTGA